MERFGSLVLWNRFSEDGIRSDFDIVENSGWKYLKRAKGFVFATGLFVVGVAFLIAVRALPLTASDSSIYGWHLKGVDTIGVYVEIGPQPDVLPNRLLGEGPRDAILGEVKHVFSQHKNVTVIAGPLPQDKWSPRVFEMKFTISAQSDRTLTGSTSVAALSARYFYYLPNKNSIEIRNVDATYPFLVPDGYEDFLKKLREGVDFLTGKIPELYDCQNNLGQQKTARCEDLFNHWEWIRKLNALTIH